MDRRNNKLRSQRGASMILALVALAICLTVGASILMSASAAADSMKVKEKEEAARLAVSSAASVIQKKVEAAELLVTTCSNGANPVYGGVTNDENSDRLITLINTTAMNMLIDGEKSSATISIDLKDNNNNKLAKTETVTVVLTVQKEAPLELAEITVESCTATAELYVSSGNAKLYDTTLHFKGQYIIVNQISETIELEENVTEEITTTTQSLTWHFNELT